MAVAGGHEEDDPSRKTKAVLNRTEASKYLIDRGVQAKPQTLAKLAVVGGGPLMHYDGRRPCYTADDLDDYAKERLRGPYRSTSEARGARVRSEVADRGPTGSSKDRCAETDT